MRTFIFTRPRGNSLSFLYGELLCQGGDFAFPSGHPRRPCPADDLWVMISFPGGIRSKTLNFGKNQMRISPRAFYLSIHLNDDRLGLTNTSTQGGQAVVGPSAACRAPPPAQFVDQGDDQPRAGRAGWVAHGNCAAVDVGLGLNGFSLLTVATGHNQRRNERHCG